MRDEKTYCIDIRDVKTRTLVMPYHRILALTVARSQATASCCRSTGSTEGRRGIPLLRRSPLNPTIRTWAAIAIATAWKAHRTCSWSATRTTSKFSPSSRSRRSLGRRSSTSSVLYTLSASYKFLTTINSQIAIVSDCPLLAPSSPVLSYIDPTSRHDRPNYLLTRRQHLGIPVDVAKRVNIFDFHDAGYGTKKKDAETTVAAESSNVHVYDLDVAGKLEQRCAFLHGRSNVLCVGERESRER